MGSELKWIMRLLSQSWYLPESFKMLLIKEAFYFFLLKKQLTKEALNIFELLKTFWDFFNNEECVFSTLIALQIEILMIKL